MDFDRVLPLIIIMVIWGVINALRKIAKVDQKIDPFKIMQQHFAVQEETGKGEEVIDLEEYSPPPFKPQTAEHEKESLIEIAAGFLPQESAVTGRETVSVSPPTWVSKPRPRILLKKPSMTSRRKLQNAIIWAEILAPPMALRDQ